MAAPVVETITDHTHASASAIVFTKPSGTAEDDLLVVFLSSYFGPSISITPPAGWTFAGNAWNTAGAGVITAVYYKVAGGAEPASYTFTYSTAVTFAGTMVRISGVDVSNPVINPSFTVNNTNGASVSVPSVSTDVDNCLLVTVGARGGSATGPTSTPDVAISSLSSSGPGVGDDLTNAVNYRADAGAAGTKTFGAYTWLTVGGAKRLAGSMAIRPEPPPSVTTFTPSGIALSVSEGSFVGKAVGAPSGISLAVAMGAFSSISDYVVSGSDGIPLTVTMGEFHGSLVDDEVEFAPTGIELLVAMGDDFSGAAASSPSGMSLTVTMGSFSGSFVSIDTEASLLDFEDPNYVVSFDEPAIIVNFPEDPNPVG